MYSPHLQRLALYSQPKIMYAHVRKRKAKHKYFNIKCTQISPYLKVTIGLYNEKMCSKWWLFAARHDTTWATFVASALVDGTFIRVAPPVGENVLQQCRC